MTTFPYTHQRRYKITPADYAVLRARLAESAPVSRALDIRTLRFASYRKRLSGPFARNIQEIQEISEDLYFSLHYFDNDPSYLRLVRLRGEEHTYATIAEAECRALLSGETEWLMSRSNPVLRDFYDSLTGQMLLPQVMLSYRREIYQPEGADVWVALDSNIRSSLEYMNFLDPERLERDAAGQEGEYLLEISCPAGVRWAANALCSTAFA